MRSDRRCHRWPPHDCRPRSAAPCRRSAVRRWSLSRTCWCRVQVHSRRLAFGAAPLLQSTVRTPSPAAGAHRPGARSPSAGASPTPLHHTIARLLTSVRARSPAATRLRSGVATSAPPPRLALTRASRRWPTSRRGRAAPPSICARRLRTALPGAVQTGRAPAAPASSVPVATPVAAPSRSARRPSLRDDSQRISRTRVSPRHRVAGSLLIEERCQLVPHRLYEQARGERAARSPRLGHHPVAVLAFPSAVRDTVAHDRSSPSFPLDEQDSAAPTSRSFALLPACIACCTRGSPMSELSVTTDRSLYRVTLSVYLVMCSSPTPYPSSDSHACSLSLLSPPALFRRQHPCRTSCKSAARPPRRRARLIRAHAVCAFLLLRALEISVRARAASRLEVPRLRI